MEFIGKSPVSFFLATARDEACRDFYEKTLGLKLLDNNDFSFVFQLHNETELRISKVVAFTPHPFTVLDWQVLEIETAMDKLKSQGIAFETYGFMKDEDGGIWTSPDGKAKIAWFKDPDDNVLSISQRL